MTSRALVLLFSFIALQLTLSVNVSGYQGGIALWHTYNDDLTYSCPAGTVGGANNPSCCPPCATNTGKVKDDKDDIGWGCWPDDGMRLSH